MAEPARQYERDDAGGPPSPPLRAQKPKVTIPVDTRIGFFTALLMLMTAMVFDGIQLATALLHGLPILGSVAAFVISIFVGIFAMIVFFLWFALAQVQGKEKFKATLIRILIMVIMAVLEITPAGVLPGTTIGVALVIFITNNAKTVKELMKDPGKLKDHPELIAALAAQGGPMAGKALQQYAEKREGKGGEKEKQEQRKLKEREERRKEERAVSQPPANDNKPTTRPWF